MRRTWKLLAIVVILPVLGLLAVTMIQSPTQGHPATPPDGQKDNPSVWMKEKLGLTQNIFAGLTRGDFEAISKNAKALDFANKLETWSRASNTEYIRQVRFFNYANRSVMEAAKQKNLEATTVAYVQLTVSCVNCHALVRDLVKE